MDAYTLLLSMALSLVGSEGARGTVSLADSTSSPVPCPSLCTCHEAPLHAAPFVHTWLRDWAHAVLPELSDNEVLDAGAVSAAVGGPAADAGVVAQRHGLHVTCALYPDTDLTQALTALPHHTMVLSILQAAGSNYTVLEGAHLAGLSSLRALFVQGFSPYRRGELPKDPERRRRPKTSQQLGTDGVDTVADAALSMALSDDALKSLVNLEILDLECVRLVVKDEVQRSRRHTWGPISTTTMVDMPFKKFLRYADDLDVAKLPNDLKSRNRKVFIPGILIDNEKRIEENYDVSSDDYEEEFNRVDQNINKIKHELSFVLLNDTENEEPVPYTVYTADSNDLFAPFTSQRSLKYLRIAHAHLDKLGPELLGGLENLHTFTLEYNHIRVLPDDVFAPTPSLRHLSIAHNALLSLEAKSFQGLNKLLTLDLEHNKLAVVGPSALPLLPQLKSLHLEGNPIKHVLTDSFVVINGTDTLVIGDDNVSIEIHNDAFRQLSNLKTLIIKNISSNSFRNSLFSGIPELVDLTLHGDISVIDFDAFTSVPELKNLDISNCGLSRISVDAFYGLSKLGRLDMSQNNIDELDPGVFDHLSRLEELYLQHNKLKTLPLGIFMPLNLKVLRLNHNPWDCSCSLLQLNPSLTNSVVNSGYHICRHDDKLNTVCNRVANSLTYDARETPKCSTPEQFKNKDVYSVASRFLKCSKEHWDPFLHSDVRGEVLTQPKKDRKPSTVQPAPETSITDLPNDQTVKESYAKDEARTHNANVRWRPLLDYTPPSPPPVDLLSIAEQQMLVEAREDTSITTTRLPATHGPVSSLNKQEEKKRMAEQIIRYRANKNKIKQQMRLQRIREIQRRSKEAVRNKQMLN